MRDVAGIAQTPNTVSFSLLAQSPVRGIKTQLIIRPFLKGREQEGSTIARTAGLRTILARRSPLSLPY
jgi:hypothetical protein